jgi:MFS family permease
MMRFSGLHRVYPSQFWLMFTGMLLSTLGASMIWPFLMIYVSEQLGLPRAATASLLTINSVAILVASFIGGPIVDRFGRKWVMVIGLLLNGSVYILYGQANSYLSFAILLGFAGLVTPLYRIGSDAMLADLLPEDKRIDGYALLRLSHNLGISVGPMVGGFIATTSYSLAFILAACGMVLYSLLLMFLARETLPQGLTTNQSPPRTEPFGGYLPVLRDRSYIQFILAFTAIQACAVLIWILLPIHAKEHYQVSERLYGFIPTTNALMVVTLQLLVTRLTKRYPAQLMMAVGGLFYAISNGAIAFSRNFWGFWSSMVIMTTGELILMPTSSTYAANHAPADKRGRYLSLYGMTWGIASGIFPVIGGLLNDLVSPQATWLGGLTVGIAASAAFLWISRRQKSEMVT